MDSFELMPNSASSEVKKDNCPSPWQFVAFGSCPKTFANQICYGIEDAATGIQHQSTNN
jgi:hypothetical protein